MKVEQTWRGFQICKDKSLCKMKNRDIKIKNLKLPQQAKRVRKLTVIINWTNLLSSSECEYKHHKL